MSVDKTTIPDSARDSFTNGKRRVMSEGEFNARWGGCGKNYCALCNRTFQIGDGWRWVYANGPKPEGESSFGNFSVCDLCDGPDVLARYQAACTLLHRAMKDRGEGHWPVNVAANLLTAHGEQALLSERIAALDSLARELAQALMIVQPVLDHELESLCSSFCPPCEEGEDYDYSDLTPQEKQWLDDTVDALGAANAAIAAAKARGIL